MPRIIVRAESADVKSNSRNAYSSLPISLQRHPRMTDPIKSLLMELASWAWGSSAVCWPSNETIGRNVGKHPDRIRVLLAEAEERGFILRVMDGRQRRIVLVWKLRGLREAQSPTLGGASMGAPAPPKAFKKREQKKRTGAGGPAGQGPPPPPDPNVQRQVAAAAATHVAVEQDQVQPTTLDELAAMAREILAGGPLAGCYRAAMAAEGIVGDEALRALVDPSPALPKEAPKNPGEGVDDQGPGATGRSPQALKSLVTCPDTQKVAGKVSSVGFRPVDLCIRRGRVSRRSRLGLGSRRLGRLGVQRVVEVAAAELPEEDVGNQVAHVLPATDRRDGQLLDDLDGQVERRLGHQGADALGDFAVFLPARPPGRVPSRLGDWSIGLPASCLLGRLDARFHGRAHESVPSWEDGLRRPQAGATVRGLSLFVGSPGRPPTPVSPSPGPRAVQAAWRSGSGSPDRAAYP